MLILDKIKKYREASKDEKRRMRAKARRDIMPFIVAAGTQAMFGCAVGTVASRLDASNVSKADILAMTAAALPVTVGATFLVADPISTAACDGIDAIAGIGYVVKDTIKGETTDYTVFKEAREQHEPIWDPRGPFADCRKPVTEEEDISNGGGEDQGPETVVNEG